MISKKEATYQKTHLLSYPLGSAARLEGASRRLLLSSTCQLLFNTTSCFEFTNASRSIVATWGLPFSRSWAAIAFIVVSKRTAFETSSCRGGAAIRQPRRHKPERIGGETNFREANGKLSGHKTKANKKTRSRCRRVKNILATLIFKDGRFCRKKLSVHHLPNIVCAFLVKEGLWFLESWLDGTFVKLTDMPIDKRKRLAGTRRHHIHLERMHLQPLIWICPLQEISSNHLYRHLYQSRINDCSRVERKNNVRIVFYRTRWVYISKLWVLSNRVTKIRSSLENTKNRCHTWTGLDILSAIFVVRSWLLCCSLLSLSSIW